jgi:phage regulator Rha-like protein
VGDIIGHKEVEEKIIAIQEQNVIIDRDVAGLYGVETKEINQAVKNNPNKFPDGYIVDLTAEEWDSLRSKILTLNDSSGRGKHTKYKPQAFTEKGLYMLATILKSQRATETTLAIVEAFAKIRELSRVISKLPVLEDECQQKALMQRSGEILTEILDDNALEVSGDETTIEINLAIMKVKHTIKREKRSK